MNLLQRILHKPFFIKLLHWEYWSMNTVYAPIYPVFLWLCIRSGWKYFFPAANPKIENGGFLMESKKDIYDQLPEGTYPKTILVYPGTKPGEIISEIKKAGLVFPLIAKPDIGMRGLAAKKIESEDDIFRIAGKYRFKYLLQEFIPFEQEAGIFYYRIPGEKKGCISGIVTKEFLTVTGDGEKTVLELLLSDKRYILQVEALKKEYKTEMDEVLKKGEQKLLVPYGNHARGAKFLDHTYLADEKLNKVIDDLMQQVPEFYYGRIDMRFSSWGELKEGKNFSIIELNGAGSEPTHIYDPRHSIFFAWKEIIRHWYLLWRISVINHKKGYRYMTYSEGARMFRDNNRYRKQLEAVHQSLLHA